MNIHYTSITGRRDQNEDRHNIILNIDGKKKDISPINLFGIYDGHGGTYVAEFLEKNIPTYYCHPELELPFAKSYHEEVFNHMQKDILKNPKGYSHGSTCLLAIMHKFKNELCLNVANVGDSRMIVISKDGKTKQITTDHSPDDPSEQKRIEKLGGEIYTDSDGTKRIGDLSVSKSFGDEDNAPYVSHEPDVFNIKLNNVKYVVMFCDGLYASLENEDIFPLIQKFKKNNSENLSVDLVEEALKEGTTDNVSLIIIELE
jgi:protein phosphatase 1L